MIKKCDHPGCGKAGTCRAPKNHELRDYWHFCKEHAAEYNKHWNYYAGMTPEEIEADWEQQILGYSHKESKQNTSDTDYIKFINDFLTGRTQFDKTSSKKTLPENVKQAFQTFNLSTTASWSDVGHKYRELAKKHHPDTASNKEQATIEFSKITNAYEILKKYFNK